MAHRVWLLYRIEITKALRRRQTYVGPVLLVAVVLFSPLVHPVVRDGLGDYGFIAYVTPLSLNFLGYIMLLNFSSTLVASEMAGGALRGTLLRPIKRKDFLLAKLFTGFSYAALLTFLVGVTSWGVVWARGDFYGVQIGGELLFTGERMFWGYVYGAMLSLLPQCAGVSLAVLFSTSTRSTSTAISLSLGTWIALDFVKYPLGIAPFIFTTYLEAPWRVFTSHCDALEYSWFPMAWQCALSSAAVIVATSALAMFLFNRRNLGSC